ncbi:maleylacetate reductase, partial [Streptomyces sp. NPDC001027]
MRFVHETLPQRVVFAPGEAAAAAAAEVAALKATKVMLIAARAEAPLADRVGADLPVAVRHD